jgi:hypothetical protein
MRTLRFAAKRGRTSSDSGDGFRSPATKSDHAREGVIAAGEAPNPSHTWAGVKGRRRRA